MVVGVVSSGGDLCSSPAVPGLTTTQFGPWGTIGTTRGDRGSDTDSGTLDSGGSDSPDSDSFVFPLYASN